MVDDNSLEEERTVELTERQKLWLEDVRYRLEVIGLILEEQVIDGLEVENNSPLCKIGEALVASAYLSGLAAKEEEEG